MDELISDDEFRAQRLALSGRLTEFEQPSPETEMKLDSVLQDLDTISEPLMDLESAWTAVPIGFQRRFQHLMLPDGYVFGRVGTAPKGHVLSFIESSLPADTKEVPLIGESWNQLANEIREFAALFREPSV